MLGMYQSNSRHKDINNYDEDLELHELPLELHSFQCLFVEQPLVFLAQTTAELSQLVALIDELSVCSKHSDCISCQLDLARIAWANSYCPETWKTNDMSAHELTSSDKTTKMPTLDTYQKVQYQPMEKL